MAQDFFTPVLGRGRGGGRKASQPDDFPQPPAPSTRELILSWVQQLFNCAFKAAAGSRFIVLARTPHTDGRLLLYGYRSNEDDLPLAFARARDEGLTPEGVIDLGGPSVQICVRLAEINEWGEYELVEGYQLGVDDLG